MINRPYKYFCKIAPKPIRGNIRAETNIKIKRNKKPNPLLWLTFPMKNRDRLVNKCRLRKCVNDVIHFRNCVTTSGVNAATFMQ